MLRNAFTELRLHPGRFLAVLTAIALSIGFLTAVQVFVATENDSMSKQQVIQTTNADVLVEGRFTDAAQALDVVRREPGVSAADLVQSAAMPLSREGRDAYGMLYSIPTDPSLQWAKVRQGTMPTTETQIALATKAAGQLDAGLGDEVTIVVGDEKRTFTVSALVDEPGLFMFPAYLTQAGLLRTAQGPTGPETTIIARTTDRAATDRAVTDLRTSLAPLALPETPSPTVSTAAEARAKAVKEAANGFDVMRNMLLVFGAIALLVGSIIISNTFSILVTQRRRQTGLLRAVGASRGQVLTRHLAEAFALGLVGSLLGVALGIGLAAVPSTWLTGSIRFGLALPWLGLLATVGVGILVTVLASLLPLRKALQVAPLEALRPVESTESERGASRVRAIVAGLLAVAGLALAFWSLSLSKNVVLTAIAGSILFTLGVLGAAPLYVPALLRVLGAPLRGNATAGLAATNAARNPARAGATATALMLAIGLIMTLGVGSASMKATMNARLDRDYPVELTVRPIPAGPAASASGRLADGMADTVKGVAGVKDAVGTRAVTRMLTLDGGGAEQPIAAAIPALETVLPGMVRLADDELLVHPDQLKEWGKADGDRASVTIQAPPPVGRGPGRAPAQPTVDPSQLPAPIVQDFTLRSSKVAGEFSLLSEATFDRLFPDAGTGLVVGTVLDRNQAAQVVGDVSKAVRTADPTAFVGGAVFIKAMIGQLLDTMLLVLSGLLGVAALIALIGVGNTLSLSVLERTRESALLRALGLQARSLRWMLLVEALLLAAVGTLVGVLAGMFFGWLGASAVLKEMGMSGGPIFAVTWWQLVAVVVVAAVAALVASILPGRRAARATPVEALADLG